LEGLAFEERDTFYRHRVYFVTICYSLSPSGIFNVTLVYFGLLYQEKSGNPEPELLQGFISAALSPNLFFSFILMGSRFQG
jgi:hypothetical protein